MSVAYDTLMSNDSDLSGFVKTKCLVTSQHFLCRISYITQAFAKCIDTRGVYRV